MQTHNAKWFAEHAGYSWDSQRETEAQAIERTGARLARAHAALAALVNEGKARITWEEDPDWEGSVGDVPLEDGRSQEQAIRAGDLEVLSCIVEIDNPAPRHACPTCGDEHQHGGAKRLAALSGIQVDAHGTGRDPYSYIVEAELAVELGLGE